MKRQLILTISLAAALLVLSQSLSAIPAFARKHSFNCNMCHVGYPKLNDWGQRFRDNGYQVPGQEGMEKTVFQTAVPLAIRTTAGGTLYSNSQGTTTGFHLYGLDMLAGGVLHKNISFLFIYTPRIDEPSADYTGSGGGSNPAQLAALESANLVFSNLIQDKLNLRIGRFEPAFQLLSAKRLYYILAPYELCGFRGSLNGFDFSANQLGIEATGRFKPGIKYALGYINGSGGDPDNSTFKDVYFAVSKTFGQGEGQTAGHRVGVFAYLGWQPTNFTGTIVSPVGDINGTENKSFYRLGGDASLNWKTFNLLGMAFGGVDNRAFNDVDPTLDYKFWGGAAELDWAGLPDNRLVGSLLYNWVRPPSYNPVHRIDAYSALVRYYLGSWSAVDVAIHAEFTHRRSGSAGQIKENLFTLLLDFAF